jgi:hypothetical protein
LGEVSCRNGGGMEEEWRRNGGGMEEEVSLQQEIDRRMDHHVQTFPEYYNKCFIPIKKRTDDGKEDDDEFEVSISKDEENEECDCKDLLLKEIELMFQNGYFFKDIEKMFPAYYTANIEIFALVLILYYLFITFFFFITFLFSFIFVVCYIFCTGTLRILIIFWEKSPKTTNAHFRHSQSGSGSASQRRLLPSFLIW